MRDETGRRGAGQNFKKEQEHRVDKEKAGRVRNERRERREKEIDRGGKADHSPLPDAKWDLRALVPTAMEDQLRPAVLVIRFFRACLQ